MTATDRDSEILQPEGPPPQFGPDDNGPAKLSPAQKAASTRRARQMDKLSLPIVDYALTALNNLLFVEALLGHDEKRVEQQLKIVVEALCVWVEKN